MGASRSPATRSAACATRGIPSVRTQREAEGLRSNRAEAGCAVVARNAANVPARWLADASAAQKASAAASPPPGVQSPEVTTALRPSVGSTATVAWRSVPKQSRCPRYPWPLSSPHALPAAVVQPIGPCVEIPMMIESEKDVDVQSLQGRNG